MPLTTPDQPLDPFIHPIPHGRTQTADKPAATDQRRLQPAPVESRERASDDCSSAQYIEQAEATLTLAGRHLAEAARLFEQALALQEEAGRASYWEQLAAAATRRDTRPALGAATMTNSAALVTDMPPLIYRTPVSDRIRLDPNWSRFVRNHTRTPGDF